MKRKSPKIFFLELNGWETQLALLKLHDTFVAVNTGLSVKRKGS